jgi:O-antigen/teichoic acid export membrane protein
MGMGGRFLLLLLIGRTLTAEDLGAFGLFAATCVILTQVVGLELHQPAVREILKRDYSARAPIVQAQLRTYYFAYLLLPPALFVAWLMGVVAVHHVALLAVVVIGTHLSLEAHRLLVASQKAERAFLVLSLAQGLWVFPLAAAMAFMPALRSLTVVFAVWAAAAVAAALIGFGSLRAVGLLPRGAGAKYDADFLRTAWPSALTFMASTTAYLLVESIDRYFLEHFHGNAAVGVYTLYSGIARVLREIGFAAIVGMSLPILVAAAQRDERSAARDEMQRMAKRLAVFTIAATPALGVGLLVVLPFLNDTRYESEVAAYFLVLASAVVGTLAMVPHYFLYAVGRERTILAIHLVTLVIAIAANWLLVPPYGIKGAAAASAICAVVMGGLKLLCMRGSLSRQGSA